MRDSHTNYFLQLMDITIWQPKAPLPGAKPIASKRFALQHMTSNELVGELWVEDAASWSQAAEDLLDAMLAAVMLRRMPPQATPVGALRILMGLALMQMRLRCSASLDELRAGNWHTGDDGARWLVTYHPLELLERPEYKRQAWVDMKKVLAALGTS